MATKESNDFISTDAKVLINDWQALHNIIEAHTQLTTAKRKDTASNLLTTLFSERQLTDALTGPYQRFIKQKLSAYATIARLRLELTIKQDDSLKIKEDEQQINPVLGSLVEQYSTNDINKMQSALDQLTNEHDEQWQAQLDQWHQQLLTSLTANNMPLTAIEIQEFQGKEPLSELIACYTDLNLDVPKLNFSDFKFEQYLKLKLELAIRSSLNRRHEAHTTADINRLLKKFKSEFEHIRQQEKTLLDQQHAETQKIIQPIVITKFKG